MSKTTQRLLMHEAKGYFYYLKDAFYACLFSSKTIKHHISISHRDCTLSSSHFFFLLPTHNLFHLHHISAFTLHSTIQSATYPPQNPTSKPTTQQMPSPDTQNNSNSSGSQPCHKQACAIQSCLTKNNYQEKHCQHVIEQLQQCCQQLIDAGGSSPSCPTKKYKRKQ